MCNKEWNFVSFSPTLDFIICNGPIIFKHCKIFFIVFSRYITSVSLSWWTINNWYSTKLLFKSNRKFLSSIFENMIPSSATKVRRRRPGYSCPESLYIWVTPLQKEEHLTIERAICLFAAETSTQTLLSYSVESKLCCLFLEASRGFGYVCFKSL